MPIWLIVKPEDVTKQVGLGTFNNSQLVITPIASNKHKSFIWHVQQASLYKDMCVVYVS